MHAAAVAAILVLLRHVIQADDSSSRRMLVGDNLVADASFEESSSDDDVTSAESRRPWTASDRKSMWSVEPRPRLTRDCDVSRSGRCSLRLDGVEAGRFRAVFFSQYVSVTSTPALGRPLRVEFWIRGRRFDHFRLQLDVSYMDSRQQLSVIVKPETEVKPADDSADLHEPKFHRKCVIVPNYGAVRSAMLHLVVETNQTSGSDVIHVDDVTVSHVTAADEEQHFRHCVPYVDSLPRNRHVIADFLSPGVVLEPEVEKQPAFSCGAVATSSSADVITLATQLTVDRLSTLDRVTSVWAGPVSAAVLVFDDGEAIRTVVDAYYRSASMRSCVTVHLVRATTGDAELFPVNFLRNVAIAHARSGRVFYVDVDVMPTFAERDARSWVDEAQNRGSREGTGQVCACVYFSVVP